VQTFAALIYSRHPHIFGRLFDSTAIEAGSSVDEKLKGRGPEAAPLLILLSVLPKLLYPAFYPEHSEGAYSHETAAGLSVAIRIQRI
jgi:hypothetical protein